MKNYSLLPPSLILHRFHISPSLKDDIYLLDTNRPHYTLEEVKKSFSPPMTLGTPEKARLAMDEALDTGGTYSLLQHSLEMGMYGAMNSFMGYAALQNIAQNGLIRACIETVSDDMTKNWIELKQEGNNKDSKEKDKKTKDALPKMATDGSKWVTMGKKREGSNGEKHGGSRVLIDTDSGKVLAVLGGKFTGQNVNAVKENSTTSSKNEKHYALPIVPKKQRKQQIIDFVKQRINIDLEKAVTGKDFKGYPYISIPGKKVGENEAILRQKILSQLQNHVEFVDGGGYGIAIVPKDFVQGEKEEREKKKAKDEMPNMIGDGGSEGTNPFALDGDFNEGEHPRDGDGKFISNETQCSNSNKENKTNGEKYDKFKNQQERIKKYGITIINNEALFKSGYYSMEDPPEGFSQFVPHVSIPHPDMQIFNEQLALITTNKNQDEIHNNTFLASDLKDEKAKRH